MFKLQYSLFTFTILGISLLLGNSYGGKEMEDSIEIITKNIASELDSGIKLQVELKNKTEETLEIMTSGEKSPFTLSVYDESGDDLNKNVWKNVSKDRSSKSTTLIFKPKESKFFELNFLNYIDDNGKEQRVPEGVYKVQVSFPIVSYVNKSYKVKLIKSEKIEVTVGGKEGDTPPTNPIPQSRPRNN